MLFWSSKEDIPDADLPYAQVVIPISEGGVKGLGNTVGIQVNARVFGIFLDGQNSQDPLVLGSLPKIEEESGGAITDVTTSQLARGTNTLSKSNDSIIDETPYDSRYKAAYPNNAVHQTSSGHVIEVDNTSGYETSGYETVNIVGNLAYETCSCPPTPPSQFRVTLITID